LLVFKSI